MNSSINGKNLVYLGPEYSFSHEGALKLQKVFPGLRIQHAPYIARELAKNTVYEAGAWDMMLQDPDTLALLPIENSSPESGLVKPHLQLLTQGVATIVAEVNVAVNMCVGGKDGTTLQNATGVTSHPQGLLQTSRWLRGLGNIAKQSADSTVAAATHVARCEDRILAISSKAALEAQGLKILAEDIANLPSKENFTQMLVLQKNGHHDTLNTTQEHHALLVRLHESAGTLGNLLQAIRVAQMNLTSLHSIKKAGIAQDVDFFIELENTDPRALSILQRQLQNPEHGLAKKCTVLGSWNTRLFTAEAPDVAVPLRTGFESGTCNPSKRFHRITIRPADYQGVLADITTMIRQASMNLLDIDSRTEGHKQYSFSMVMDGVSSNPAFTELLHEQLATSPMTYSLSWQSGDTVSSL